MRSRPYSVELGGATGISRYTVKVERRLSDLQEYFAEKNLVERMLSIGENPLIYEVYELSQEPIEGMFNVGCTVIHPGKIGDEYYFTKGHFHQKESASEVYVGLEGEGVVLMQDHEGKTTYLEIKPNVLVYIPPGKAHRSVNTGNSKLIFLAIYPSDAGHDYEIIRTKGFAKLVAGRGGRTQILESTQVVSKQHA